MTDLSVTRPVHFTLDEIADLAAALALVRRSGQVLTPAMRERHVSIGRKLVDAGKAFPQDVVESVALNANMDASVIGWKRG